jgi:hypothetical protein
LNDSKFQGWYSEINKHLASIFLSKIKIKFNEEVVELKINLKEEVYLTAQIKIIEHPNTGHSKSRTFHYPDKMGSGN